jgi:hypothetical protein
MQLNADLNAIQKFNKPQKIVNNTNNINITINVNNFGEEDLSLITQDIAKKAIEIFNNNSGCNKIIKLLSYFYGEKSPIQEYRNIQCTDINREIIKLYDKDRIITAYFYDNQYKSRDLLWMKAYKFLNYMIEKFYRADIIKYYNNQLQGYKKEYIQYIKNLTTSCEKLAIGTQSKNILDKYKTKELHDDSDLDSNDDWDFESDEEIKNQNINKKNFKGSYENHILPEMYNNFKIIKHI